MIKGMTKSKILLCGTLLSMGMFLVGCFATGSQFQQTATLTSPRMANVYVYRANGFIGILVSESVYLDNVKVGSVRDGGFIVLHITPGPHILQITDLSGESKYISRPFIAAAKNNYYFKIGAAIDGSKTNYIGGSKDNNYAPIPTPGFTNFINPIPPTMALQELSSLRQSN